MAENEPQEEPTLKILTSVPSRAEAGMVIGELEAAGVYAMQRPGTQSLGFGACDIYVREQDLDRAREVLNEPISEGELIQAEEEAATQLTQPRVGDPIEIPVPKREDVEDF